MKPVYIHDCDNCKYLGTDTIDDNVLDFYYCHREDPMFSSLIARYSSDGGDYSSGVEFCMPSIYLNKALEMAVKQNVLTLEELKYIKNQQEIWFNYYNKTPDYAKGIDNRWEGKTRFVIT
jgi:hypothetical protein